MSNSRGNMIAVLVVNIPQVIAAIVVLSLYWRNPSDVCDAKHNAQWIIWSSISTIRMAVYSIIVVIMFYWKAYFENHTNHFMQIIGFRNIVDAMGLVWFIIGNLWLFGDDDSNSCTNPHESPIYNLCFSMVIINYLQICLPCILAALLLPLFCFCMPCLIRILARYNRTNQVSRSSSSLIIIIIIFIITICL